MISIYSGKPAADATVPLVTGGNLSPIDLKVSAEYHVLIDIRNAQIISSHPSQNEAWWCIQPPQDLHERLRNFKSSERNRDPGMSTPNLRNVSESATYECDNFLSMILCWQACVVEFHSPERFYLHTQTPEMVKMLQTIGVELQKANIYPQALTYTPCVDEVCAVQFSRDMVRKVILSLLSACILKEQMMVGFCFCFFKRIELVQGPGPGFGCWPDEGKDPLHWLWQWGRCPFWKDQATCCRYPAVLSLCKFKAPHVN